MKLTIAEILHYPEFSGFTLIAGATGISNQITSCGILDYEYDRTLKNKYTKLSFIPNQLILSS
ncbi:MAG: PucR family transcriptional regulator ligand-binding domain-containing protein, partial [Caecibacter massiliensis]|nr:PucR family transcriptional regulator ligand-binding domain-containing protein [Caecibacter massiliensis]